MSGIVERLREEALALQQTAWSRMDGGQQCSLNASMAEEAADEIERLRSALREFDCPRPANDRPDDFEVGQCVDAGECGCGARFALTGEPVPGGIPLEDRT